MKLNNDHRTGIKTVPTYVWCLLLIMVVGIFFRVYRFHDWLEFKGDQARDAEVVSGVILGHTSWPLLGPVMGNSATDSGEHYRIGPMYYSFQIISAKLFGNTPDSLAYPDLLFSILTIPLFFLFLRRLFGRNLALGLTGLYSVSFFAIRYSRFAWNSNLIPFFVLLFLLSIGEFERKRENVGWPWVIALGIALGVGVQLHVILLTIFPVFAGLILLRSASRYRESWKKWAVILFLCIVLNAGQILSETRTNFANSRIFLNYFTHTSVDGVSEEKRPASLMNDIDCHIEGNFYMLSSLGPDSCSYYLNDLIAGESRKLFHDTLFRISLLASLSLSLFGYGLFAYRSVTEEDIDRRQWLRMLALYLGVSFLIMFPVLKAQVELRYFSFAFFVPFLFLGLFIDTLSRMFPGFGRFVVPVLFGAVLSANASSLLSITTELMNKTRLYSNSVVLDEMEPIVDYMRENSGGKTDLYLGGDSKLMDYTFFPLSYLSGQKGIRLIRVASEDESVSFGRTVPSFYVNNKKNSAKSSAYLKIGEKIFVHKF
ncbi:MAG: glycosyltransferase family 39 protein [Candidatus Moraniibacteriota bacterium]